MRSSSWGCSIMIALLCITSLAIPLWASTSDPEKKTEVGDRDRPILKRSNAPVWFDAGTGTVRPIHRSKSIYVDDRHDSVVNTSTSKAPSWWSGFRLTLSDFFTWIFQGWKILLVICLVGLLLLALFLVLHYGFGIQIRGRKGLSSSVLDRDKAKLQDLPFEVEQTMLGLLSQAEKYRAAGDYSKAIIYLFSHALVEMDSARCIRLERGKTNRVYLRELREHESLKGFTNQLIVAFEFAFFGKHVLSRDAFERLWDQVPAFDARLKQIVSSQSVGLNLLPARLI